MPWWGWVLATWVVVGTGAGLWIAAAGGIARQRERAARAHRHGEAVQRARNSRREAGTQAPADGSSSGPPELHETSARRKWSRMAESGE